MKPKRCGYCGTIIAEECFYFDHVLDYPDQDSFRKVVILFLENEKSSALLEDSFGFSCRNNFDCQKEQTDAINEVFDERYGKGLVRWHFKTREDCRKGEVWGVYLIIKGQEHSICNRYKKSVDCYIWEKLRDGK